MAEEQNDVAWFLQQQGLNLYQRKAYEALLALKNASASEIASQSGVPEAKLYEVLNALERRGLLQSSVGRPKRFSIIEPQRAFSTFLAGKKAELEREKGILRRVSELSEKGRRPEETISLLRGRDVVLRHMTSYLKDRLSESYDACFPFNNAYIPMMNLIRQKVRDGVRVRLIGEVTPGNYAVVQRYLKWGAQVRNCRKIIPPEPLRFSIYDGKMAAFTLTDVNREYLTIWTDSEPVVKSIADLFTYYWTNGAKVD